MASSTAAPLRTAPQRPAGRWRRLLGRRSVRLALAGWFAVNALLLGLGGRHLPFSAPALAEPPTAAALLGANVMVVEVLGVMVLVHLLTRHRVAPDLAGRVPARPVAAVETLAVLGYGLVVMAGGFVLGRAFGWHALGLHLDGMVVHTVHDVEPREALAWAAYNLLVYAVLPFAVFRRRYSTRQLGLHSTDRRADRRLVVVVLALESAVQLTVATPTVLDLSARQALLGAPLTFALGMAGTVLPTLVFVQCILVPRYLELTRSVPAAVVLGGLTYALLHVTDGWTDLTSPADAVVSALYVALFYTAPGMLKAFLTLRTGNAWVHAWAYHAIAPHTLLDTPLMVRVFGIR